LPKNVYRWRVAMAQIQASQGELDAALELLDEAAPLYVSDFSPNVRPVSALKARVWIAQGKLEQALDWARQNGLSVDDKLSYLREFEHITLARILLAQHNSSHAERPLRDAIGLLERLGKAAQDGGRMNSAIEIYVLQALAHQMQSDLPAALGVLERALTTAEPEGYIRILLDEGESMRLLIKDLRLKLEGQSRAQNNPLVAYVDKILDAFSGSSAGSQLPTMPTENLKSKMQNLIEPLSQRELDILRLFKTELSGPEIARELVVALSTVRTHTKSIYSKLNVNSRRAAVKRAMELGLI
jgi:LuxR family transcriptional regulator, maltose regulon positive regulatory protein